MNTPHIDEFELKQYLAGEMPAAKVLADTLAQLRWAARIPQPSRTLAERHPARRVVKLPAVSAGCAGVPGAYAHIACERLLEHSDIRFYHDFADVAAALVKGEVALGVLPVENSSAGQVGEVLELVSSHDLYIAQTVDIKAEHCLCIHPDSDPGSLRRAISHPQALAQCKGYLAKKGFQPEPFSNTAAAAKQVARAPGDAACLCSERGAALYGLRVLERGVQDFDDNYTRFLCVSREHYLLPGADTISITLSLPNEPGELHRMLTRFAACHLDLSRLLSMPIASRDFSVLFHLDFRGSILDKAVARMLGAMYDEFSNFKFLGNYSRI